MDEIDVDIMIKSRLRKYLRLDWIKYENALYLGIKYNGELITKVKFEQD